MKQYLKTARFYPIGFYKKLVAVVGRFNARVLLTVVYFLILPIFALIHHIETLIRKPNTATSTWIKKEPERPRAYEQQF